jgi:hypothetical protein
VLLLEFCVGSNMSILFVFWYSIVFLHSLAMSSVRGRRSPSLPSYSDMGQHHCHHPLPHSPRNSKPRLKRRPSPLTSKDRLNLNMEERNEKMQPEKPSLSFRIFERISFSGDYNWSIYSSGHIFRFSIFVHCPSKVGHSSLLILLYDR